jgi:NADPH-dependent ferric siderophore reductase
VHVPAANGLVNNGLINNGPTENGLGENGLTGDRRPASQPTRGGQPGSRQSGNGQTTKSVVRRVYSIWSLEPVRSRLTLRVAVHAGDAPGCVWARTAREGDRITLEEPRSKITIDAAARFHLFVGDETGAVPLLAMRAALDRVAPAYGVFEAPDEASEVPGKVDVPGIKWVHRGQKPAVASRVLLQALRDMTLPSGHGVAYVAGESATTRLLQRHLVEQRGWPRRAVLAQPQWAPDRPGFGAGVE